MSALRARCPVCRTLTAVAVDSGYQCHRCGGEFGAGLVRVPKAWGRPDQPAPPPGAEGIAEAAFLPVPFPETGVIERDTLDDQTGALAASLPERPLILGGCCCAHAGAVRGLASRTSRLAVVWLDAHGDLNTPETSPSGNLWGMPFRMILDEGLVEHANAALVGARNLDPPELDFLAETGIDDSLGRALADADGVYVAFDVDVLDPGEAAIFMPEPGGMSLAEAEAVLREIAARAPIVGMGITALLPEERNVAVVERLTAAAGIR
jgi:arginase family enzyme